MRKGSRSRDLVLLLVFLATMLSIIAAPLASLWYAGDRAETYGEAVARECTSRAASASTI